jgi:sterol desaturase/sphingolipid hydroxylase (fatty acid hydroxylase superfamily)
MDASPGHEYRERQVPDMSNRFLRVGQGRISGYASAFLGVMSFLTVLCFRYPSYLTTAELRSVYDPDQIRLLLRIGICVSLGFGLATFALGRRKRMGAIGVLFTLAALALGAWNVHGSPVEPREVSLGLDWLLLDFVLSVVVFTFIEKVIPKYDEQAILRPEWRLDLVYFSVNHLLISVLLLVGNSFAPMAFGWATNARMQAFVTSLPVAGQFVLLVFGADLVQYWTHRAFHEVPWLWKFHAVHHSSEHMDWLAGSRSHFIEILVDRSLVMVPLYLLGPDKGALDAYVLFAALQAVLVHANVALPFGPLRYLVTTPQYHHWHHSSDKPAIDTNYAVHLPVYDKLFGTFHMPGRHWPAEYGTTKRLPRTLVAQALYPFQRIEPVVAPRPPPR